ncbi:hypothetical protein ACFO0N_12110 [Halobium salinum]|uniref:Major facilitator superfamily (MFS) profile domain-containing protein n=1 Tax=Halobium salinum TaxID=1364940 RepID=A0ABD5PCU1_9EURY|nr:hypothetical protein [Halobium salinum]
MDEALDVVDAFADAGLDGIVVWLLRLVGLLAVVAGLGLWLFTEMGLLFLPALLVVAGLFLLVVPGLVVELAEVAG